jgi:hypothetical protein
MSMKDTYFYFFYKLYYFFENYAIPAYWSEWKASIFMNGLILFLISSILHYFKIYFFPNLNVNGDILIFIAIIIFIINYFILIHKDTWKVYNKKFAREKNKYSFGSWIIIFVILFIMANFVLSSYLLYLERFKV